MKTSRASGLTRLLPSLLAAILVTAPAARAVDGVWNLNNTGNWSLATNWTGSAIADGAGSIADFSLLNISAARTVTIDTTSRTVGTFLIGDSTSSFFGYTIAASGGATLSFNNSGSTALLTQTVNSGANTFSAPIVLADNLNVTNNNATSTLTISGGITGAKNLTLNANDAGGITLSTGSINNGGTITNSGSGSGITTISGIIGTNVTSVVQDSATSQLTLSGANTFAGGVTIKQGTLVAGNNTAALGTGTVLLGDTSGNKDATLRLANGLTYANAITVQAGSSGNKLTIEAGALNKAVLSGLITLNNDLTLALTAPGGVGGVSTTSTLPYLTISGEIGGTKNLNLNLTGLAITSNAGGAPQSSSYTLSGAITTSGSLTDVSTGTGWKTISGNISNLSSLNQNSATSMLILSGANIYSGATNVNAGILRSTSAGGLSTNSAITVASGATLQISTSQSTTQTLTLSGNGSIAGGGALESTNSATYAGAVILQDDATVADSLATTTLTLSGGLTGSGKNLTVTGIGNTTLSAGLATGSGSLIKEGTGLLTLSAANTFTGLTQINNGTILLSHANALGGGGSISFGGGTLRHGSSNTVDYASRIVNSTGPISIDTNNSNVTYSSGLAASNTGGLTKLGLATLTLSGTNAYTGITAINGGGLAISSGALSTGNLFIDSAGVLNGNGAYTTAQAWLNSGKISTDSTGGLALMDNSNVDLTGYGNLMLTTSTTGNTTYTGTITPAGGLYRLAGNTSNQNLTLSGANALTGTNGLIVGARNGSGASAGSVVLSNSNDLTGATTVNAGTLSLASAGTIAGSAVTVNSGSTLAVTTATSGSPVTRVASLKLAGGTLTVAGNSTANSTDTVSGALTVGAGGNSIITLTPNASRNTLLTAGSFAREAGGTALIRGTSLGANAFGTINSANISLTTPNLVGNGGTGTDRSIFVGVVGDTTTAGTGFGATGGLLTYDATNGVRRLSGADYKTSITDGQITLDNIQLTSTGSPSATATTTLTSDTIINSLSLTSTTVAGANIQVIGAGKLTLNSGMIYAGSVTASTASGISNTIDFNGREGVILAGGSADFGLSGVLSNTNNNGLTVYASASRTVTLSGAAANTYTGTTTVNGGTLALAKTAGINAIPGDLAINSGATVSYTNANQIADSANVTVNGGTLSSINDTINNLTATSGSITTGSVLNVAGNLSLSGNSSLNVATLGALTVTGTTNLSDGGSLTLSRSNNLTGNYDTVATLNGALNITNRPSGAYTAITLNFGNSVAQSGGKLILGGDVTFTGNSTNTNTVLIDAPKGSGRQGQVALTGASPGNRTFTIGNDAAAVDLTITAPLVDGSGGASGLTKAGLGTLALSGANTYTGGTTVSAGTLALSGAGTFGTGSLTVSGGTADLGTKSITNVLGALTGGGALNNGTITNNSSNYDMQNGTVGAILAGTNALTKSTGSTVTLNAANSYSGNTTISAGTLALGASGSFANSPVINLGSSGTHGTLDLTSKASFSFGTGQTVAGYGTINIGTGKVVTVLGTLAPGNSPGIVSVTGDLVLANAATVPVTGAITTMELGGNGGVAGADYDKIIASGQITFGGTLNIVSYLSYNINQAATYHLFGFGSQTGNFDFVSVAGTSLINSSGVWTGTASSFDYTFTQNTGDLVISLATIPEPSTYAALFGALALAGAALRRRRS